MATPVSAMMRSKPSKRDGIAHVVRQQAVALLHGPLELAEQGR